MQHPTFTAALADQHRQALARQALARRASLARAGPEQPAHRPVAVACHGPLVAAGHPASPGLNNPWALPGPWRRPWCQAAHESDPLQATRRR